MSEDKKTKLEKEFEKAHKDASERIEEQLDIARQALVKARLISEEYGVPFETDVSPVGNSYTPTSFEVKFEKLDRSKIWDEFGVWPDEYAGWEHSAAGC